MRWQLIIVLGATVVIAPGCKDDEPDAPMVPDAMAVDVPTPVVVDSPEPAAAPDAPAPAPPRQLVVSLRSTPAGATVSVDGESVGETPVVFEVDDDRQAREFRFVLEGHAPRVYRMPTLRDGVIHARLVKIAGVPADASLAAEH